VDQDHLGVTGRPGRTGSTGTAFSLQEPAGHAFLQEEEEEARARGGSCT